MIKQKIEWRWEQKQKAENAQALCKEEMKREETSQRGRKKATQHVGGTKDTKFATKKKKKNHTWAWTEKDKKELLLRKLAWDGRIEVLGLEERNGVAGKGALREAKPSIEADWRKKNGRDCWATKKKDETESETRV